MKTINVIHHFGSKSLAAKALGTSKQAVGQWGSRVPKLRQFQLEVITNGKLKSEFTLKNIEEGRSK